MPMPAASLEGRRVDDRDTPGHDEELQRQPKKAGQQAAL
jgi:hypothetical protein